MTDQNCTLTGTPETFLAYLQRDINCCWPDLELETVRLPSSYSGLDRVLGCVSEVALDSVTLRVQGVIPLASQRGLSSHWASSQVKDAHAPKAFGA